MTSDSGTPDSVSTFSPTNARRRASPGFSLSKNPPPRGRRRPSHALPAIEKTAGVAARPLCYHGSRRRIVDGEVRRGIREHREDSIGMSTQFSVARPAVFSADWSEKSDAPMRAVVVGGSGQIGGWLSRFLAERGHHSVGTYSSQAFADLVPLDASNPEAVTALLRPAPRRGVLSRRVHLGRRLRARQGAGLRGEPRTTASRRPYRGRPRRGSSTSRPTTSSTASKVDTPRTRRRIRFPFMVRPSTTPRSRSRRPWATGCSRSGPAGFTAPNARGRTSRTNSSAASIRANR